MFWLTVVTLDTKLKKAPAVIRRYELINSNDKCVFYSQRSPANKKDELIQKVLAMLRHSALTANIKVSLQLALRSADRNNGCCV